MGTGKIISGFKELPHEADIAIRAWGRTLEQMFGQAALGMLSLMLERPKYIEKCKDIKTAGVKAIKHIDVKILASGTDYEGLLVAWLNEVLYQTTVKKIIPVKFNSVKLSKIRPNALGGARVTLRAPTGAKLGECGGLQAATQVSAERFDPARHRYIREIKSATFHGLKIIKTTRGYEATIVFDV